MSSEPTDHQTGGPSRPLTTGVRCRWSPKRVTEGSSARSDRRKLPWDFILFGGRARRGLSPHSTLWTVRESGGGPCVRVAVCSWISSSGTALRDTPSRYADDGRDRHSARRRRTRIPPHGG